MKYVMENNNIEIINQETLSVILKEHQLWIESKGKNGKRADLKLENLHEANLHGANLEGANLEEAILFAANLKEANLSSAELRGAYLSQANLKEANLSSAKLCGAHLSQAKLRGANLEGANLEGANLKGANLEGANLERAYLDGAYLDGAYLEGVKHTLFRLNSDHLLTDNLQRKLQSSEATIQELEEKLKQAQQDQSETVKNDEEITKLNEQLNLEKSEKQKITEKLEELNNLLNKSKEELRGRIKDAQKSLSEALKNTDKQIKNNENSASCFSRLGIGLLSLTIILLLVFSGFVLCHPKFFVEKNLNILFYTFPIITLMVIGTTCLRHQKNLLAEVRHFSDMKHQIELYSGLLEASQHAAVSFNHPKKANEYVQETFTQIRNRLLNSQYLPDNSSADKQSDNDFGSDKVLDLLNKIVDLSGKKSMGN